MKTSKKQTHTSKNRILSVTIKRMIDDSPDTSYLGEYSSNRTSEFSIDRRHSQDCMSIEWNHKTAVDMLGRIIARIEETQIYCADHIQSTDDGCAECSIEFEQAAAISMLSNLQDEITECDCRESGRFSRSSEYAFFNPSFNYVDENGHARSENTPEEVRKYVRQDYERMEGLNSGDWCFIRIRAEAQIGIPQGNPHPKTGQSYLLQKFTSGGLWGIESDSDKGSYCTNARHATPCSHETRRPCQACLDECEAKDNHACNYLEQVEEEQLEELRDVLKGFGFSSRSISRAFQNIQHKDA